MTPPTTPPEQPVPGKKAPSKAKIGFDLVLGGFMLSTAICMRPYDSENLVVGVFGLLWIASAAIDFDRHF